MNYVCDVKFVEMEKKHKVMREICIYHRKALNVHGINKSEKNLHNNMAKWIKVKKKIGKKV